jgi:hypothetical protein
MKDREMPNRDKPTPLSTDDTTNTCSLKLTLAEYEEAGRYRRHYSNLRFAILPIYFAVVGALAAVAAGVAVSHTKVLDLPRCAAGGAAFVTLVFFNFEVVCERYLAYFKRRQVELESILPFKTMAELPSNHNLVLMSTWLFYSACFAFWIYVVVEGA